MNKLVKKLSAVVTGVVALAVTQVSMAAPPDVSAFTALGPDITATATTLFTAFAGVAAGVWILYYVFGMAKRMSSKAKG